MSIVVPNRDSNGNVVSTTSPFASKELAGKKLYKRVHGISESLSSGSNTVSYTITYPWCKINAIEVIGAELGDTMSLKVKDDASGTYSGTANYVLNQFGFDVNIAKDYYEHKSEFDADLYVDMVLEITYTSQSAKSIGINFILNELKD